MEFNENVIYEPDCFAIRRMPAHSDHGYYATGKEADGVESVFSPASMADGNLHMPIT